MSIDWGDVPTWVTAVPTALAFSVAALSYRSSVSDRRSAQARRVYVTTDQVGSYHKKKQVPTSNLIRGPHTHMEAPLEHLGLAKDGRGNVIYLAQEDIVVITVTLHNGSDEPINAWRVQFERPNGELYPAVSAPMGATNPGGQTSFTTAIAHELPPDSVPTLVPVIYFEDSADRWWKRRLNESVREVKRKHLPST